MLKNVVVINDFDYIQGGASKVAIQTANLLKENNPDLNVYFFSGAHDSKSNLRSDVISICTNQGESLKSKNKLKGAIDNLYNFKAKKLLKELLLTLDRDETIIHVHGWTKCLSSSVFDVAFKMNFKLVLTLHDYFTACPNGGYFNYQKNEIWTVKPFSLKYILTNCDSRNYFFHLYRLLRFFIQDKIVRLNDRLTDVITISDFSENILKKTLSPSTHIHRVYNPIDLDPNREIVDYTKNDYFLYVGRISKEKGVDVFCEGVTKANKKGVVVGDGSELEKLKNKYPNIEFVGWKNSQEVKEYMKKAKALIIPSRWYEAAPLTPIEALQYGIPIISSDCNATIDYLESDKNGAVFSISSENLDEIISTFSDCYKPSIPFVSNYSQDITALYNEIIIVKES
ncbi:glycosyltransferase family 4 protein [Streptococcus equinus]|uniref:Glycosyltransferase involved in cell wall bisynthesis n=1 Tax=Streptococcus equinus TaxID=1335 RepID=A0AAE8HJG2_STREI|nr:glycosyltransferase family 4 protein [Streptococcus equinus]SDW25904.1 Glycosyltransferase involved in cell wall bisynthesis [Streptococcus equinus]